MENMKKHDTKLEADYCKLRWLTTWIWLNLGTAREHNQSPSKYTFVVPKLINSRKENPACLRKLKLFVRRIGNFVPMDLRNLLHATMGDWFKLKVIFEEYDRFPSNTLVTWDVPALCCWFRHTLVLFRSHVVSARTDSFLAPTNTRFEQNTLNPNY